MSNGGCQGFDAVEFGLRTFVKHLSNSVGRLHRLSLVLHQCLIAAGHYPVIASLIHSKSGAFESPLPAMTSNRVAA